ncbi:hypothetical protein [uncultured Dysosmobacter sp.]|uniref:hypothetical protein n=1 Tax=uncultured Dysosmobacter sp. TaxID=2591384 RepID=UPI002671BCD7|nr:hypothetical protein [uncultured Dysosmobacter sp.]
MPSFVVADAAWAKNKGNTPAFSAGGQIYFRETMPEQNRGMYATHEITHVMKQVGYTPYLDFVSKTPDMLDMSTLEARILLEHTAKHRGIDPFNTSLSETDRLNLYDELNATLYGHISSGNMGGLNEILNTAFYDFSAYTKELNELHERFKSDNQKKWKEKTRYSLKNYSDAEQRDHRKKAIAFFGKTYNWNETGYLTPAGTKLDFSGRHEGGPGGYRTVDHRDIRDAIGEDYGGDDYSGSMVQFMSEGNIRISPESGGINLSVEPTKSQLDALSDFIGKNRGEVILDLDTPDGQTVSSTEYPRGTHSSKVLNDIKAYFKDGTKPHVSELAQFLSLKGTENAQEIAALKRENESLKARVEYWKGQTRRSQGVTTDRKSVQKAANALVKDYGAEISGSDIAGDLQSLYDFNPRICQW